VFADEVAESAPVLAGRVGHQVVHAPAGRALAFAGWPPANAVLRAGRPQSLPGADLQALVLLGCDPALGLAAALLPSSGSQRVIALSGSTATALAAMREGRAHGALVHGRPDALPACPDGAVRIHLARWRVGVADRPERARSVAELCAQGATVVQREAGASSQKAFAAAVAAEGGRRLPGPVAAGHLEVARRVAESDAAGVTMEPAAISWQLAFASLEEHVAEVWVDERWHAHPAVGALGEVLRSAAFTARVGLIGGYQLDGCGDRV
jgi:molybdate-binding protein